MICGNDLYIRILGNSLLVKWEMVLANYINVLFNCTMLTGTNRNQQEPTGTNRSLKNISQESKQC